MTGQRRVVAEERVPCPGSGTYVASSAARPCWHCGQTLLPENGRLPEHTITVRRYDEGT